MRRLSCIGILALCGLLSACTTTTVSTPPPADAPLPLNDPTARTVAAQAESDQLRSLADQLPGQTSADSRRLYAQAFNESADVLQLLEGPNPSGAFQTQIMVVRQAQANMPLVAELDPRVDEGLRGLLAALQTIHREQFQSSDAFDEGFQHLQSHINQLDDVRGPLHGVITAQAFRAATELMQSMAAANAQRIGTTQPN